MRLPETAGGGHLSYCTNIHAGESWAEVRGALTQHLPAVKAAASPEAPFGVGLRLGAAAAHELADPAALAELRGLLERLDGYVFTLNGFPFGAFHGTRVKEQVYAPDWGEDERLDYSNRLADILAALLPEGVAGSISTVPVTYRPWAEGRLEGMTRNIARHAARLAGIEAATGRHLTLALEPEPCCYLETIAETVRYFERHLFADPAVGELAEAAGLDRDAGRAAMRRHVGVCYDVCHAAVEYEDPKASIAALRHAGIRVAKLQLSSALRIAEVSPEAVNALAAFDEPVYLHQVIERRGARLRRYRDLPEALPEAARAAGAEWRVHFHVPVFLEAVTDFGTTQAFLREILALQRRDPIAPHLEVETYTWDVLPACYRNVSVSEAIARELRWVRDQLGA